MALSWSMFPYRKPYTDICDLVYDKTKERKKKIELIMYRDLINSLIIDRYFDIYTRNGFEYVLGEVEDDCKIFLVDFDDIRGMNHKYGYTKVNDIMKKTFSELKEQYIIGRAFSGDEIFFFSYDLNDNIDVIRNVCFSNNLTFAYTEDIHKVTSDISDTLENMIKNFH